jgi:uncharacterized membrane protein
VIILLVAGLLSMVSLTAEVAKTAATIFNTPGEEVLVTPQTLIMEKGQVVKDPAARSGWALMSDPAHAPGKGCVSFWYTYKQDPGKVRITYRLKVADNTDPRPVALVQVCIWENDLKRDPNPANVETPIRGTDFRTANSYQDFSFEVAKGEAGYGGWGVTTTGITQLWCDGINVTQVSRFTPLEILALVHVPEKPAELKFAPLVPRIHETDGLFMAAWRFADAVKLLGTAEWTHSHLSVHPQHTTLTDYPRKWQELYGYSTVVLNNVPAKAVSLTGCLMLKQYLEDGGCVVLVGDTHSLAQGQWAETALGPLLPVTLPVPSDLVRPSRPLLLAPCGTLFADLQWNAQPYTMYYHAATLRPGARLLCASGDIPLIAEQAVGRGRLIVCLLSVMGEPNAKFPGVPFWQWADWPKLLAQIIKQP